MYSQYGEIKPKVNNNKILLEYITKAVVRNKTDMRESSE